MDNLILASSYKDRLASWKEGLNGFINTSVIVDGFINDSLETLRDDAVRIKPEVILIDFDLLGINGANGAASLRKLCVEAKTIVMTSDISEDLEWGLLKAGVRGCCRNDIQPKILQQVVMAVTQGELWFRRTLTCRLIDELGKITSKNKAYRATLGLLNNLTQREYDIAVRVGNGESNKQISKGCGITERTVKSHLTEIYLKLGVVDRLNLGLVLSADNRAGAGNSDNPLNGRSRANDSKS